VSGRTVTPPTAAAAAPRRAPTLLDTIVLSLSAGDVCGALRLTLGGLCRDMCVCSVVVVA
jgi:hypothetical protein